MAVNPILTPQVMQLRNKLADLLAAERERILDYIDAHYGHGLHHIPSDGDVLADYDTSVLAYALQQPDVIKLIAAAYDKGSTNIIRRLVGTVGLAHALLHLLSERQRKGTPVGKPIIAVPAVSSRHPVVVGQPVPSMAGAPSGPMVSSPLQIAAPPILPPSSPPAPPSSGASWGGGRGPPVDLGIVWGLKNKLAVAYAQQRAAELVGRRRLADGTLIENPNAKWQITQTTRDKIAEMVNQVMRGEKDERTGRPFSYRDLKDKIQELPGWNNLFGEYRAEMIARSELALAQNAGVLEGHKAGGIKRVRVLDGTDFDDACRQANGKIWPIDYAMEHSLEHPHCLTGGTLVFAPNVTATFTRWFDGEVVILRTSANDLLTVTTNHPILTDHGWIDAGLLGKGDHIMRCRNGERVMGLIDPDHDYAPSLIENISDTFGPFVSVMCCGMPTTSETFNSDGVSSNICVIRTNGALKSRLQSKIRKHGTKISFVIANASLMLLNTKSTIAQLLKRSRRSTSSFMCGGGSTRTFLLGRSAVIDKSCISDTSDIQSEFMKKPSKISGVHFNAYSNLARRFTRDVTSIQVLDTQSQAIECFTTKRNISFTESIHDSFGSDMHERGDLLDRLSGLIEPTSIISVERTTFHGYVYNLETSQGWYIAENIITHNCTRAFSSVQE